MARSSVYLFANNFDNLLRLFLRRLGSFPAFFTRRVKQAGGIEGVESTRGSGCEEGVSNQKFEMPGTGQGAPMRKGSVYKI